MNAIEIKNLSKKYKSGFELKDINLEIEEGTITGFIGENGAGKSTLIKLILDSLIKDSGTIKIFGKEVEDAKEDVGIVLDSAFFPEIFTAKDIENVLKETYKNWDSNVFNDLLVKFNIANKGQIKDMSKGMKKKLEIATALAHKPKLLILDEPTSGLDPVIRSEVLDIFLDFIQKEENTIFLSTHITSDLDKIADNIIFIDQGKIY